MFFFFSLFRHSSNRNNRPDRRQERRHEHWTDRVLHREPTPRKDSYRKGKPSVQVSDRGCQWPTVADDVQPLSCVHLRCRGEAVSRSAPSRLRLRLDRQGPDSRGAGGRRDSRSRSWRCWAVPFGWVWVPFYPSLCVCPSTGGSGSEGPSHSVHVLVRHRYPIVFHLLVSFSSIDYSFSLMACPL